MVIERCMSCWQRSPACVASPVNWRALSSLKRGFKFQRETFSFLHSEAILLWTNACVSYCKRLESEELRSAHIVNGNAAIDSSQVIQLNLVKLRKSNVSSQVCRAYLSNYMELHPNLQVLTRCKLKPHVAKKIFGVFRQQQSSNVESVKPHSQWTWIENRDLFNPRWMEVVLELWPEDERELNAWVANLDIDEPV